MLLQGPHSYPGPMIRWQSLHPEGAHVSQDDPATGNLVSERLPVLLCQSSLNGQEWNKKPVKYGRWIKRIRLRW